MQKVIDALFSLKEATASFASQGFVTKCFLIFIVDEVKNFAANNIFFKLLELVTYWDSCKAVSHVLESVHHQWRSYTREFRDSEVVEGFYYKFIYGDCRVQGQRFCTRFETSLYYSGLLFRKVSPQVFFTVKLICLIGFPGSSYLVLFNFSLHDFDIILMFVCFNKFYS